MYASAVRRGAPGWQKGLADTLAYILAGDGTGGDDSDDAAHLLHVAHSLHEWEAGWRSGRCDGAGGRDGAPGRAARRRGVALRCDDARKRRVDDMGMAVLPAIHCPCSGRLPLAPGSSQDTDPRSWQGERDISYARPLCLLLRCGGRHTCVLRLAVAV